MGLKIKPVHFSRLQVVYIVNSPAAMGAPMSATKPVDNPAEAFLSPHDGVAISFWIISIAMIAATVFFFAEAATVHSHWKTSLLPAWPAFIMGMLGWFFILYEIFAGEAGGTASGCSEAVAASFKNMRMIVTAGWSIYPLG